MQRYIAIIIFFIATATSSMADTNGKLIQRIDSIIDNITQIYGKKQARIDFYKSMAHKSQKPETLLSAYDKLYDEYFGLSGKILGRFFSFIVFCIFAL